MTDAEAKAALLDRLNADLKKAEESLATQRGYVDSAARDLAVATARRDEAQVAVAGIEAMIHVVNQVPAP